MTTPARSTTKKSTAASHSRASRKTSVTPARHPVELKPLGREVVVDEPARAHPARAVPATAPAPSSATDAAGGEFAPNP